MGKSSSLQGKGHFQLRKGVVDYRHHRFGWHSHVEVALLLCYMYLPFGTSRTLSNKHACDDWLPRKPPSSRPLLRALSNKNAPSDRLPWKPPSSCPLPLADSVAHTFSSPLPSPPLPPSVTLMAAHLSFNTLSKV